MKLRSWISIRPLRHYKGDDRTKCPDCGREMVFVERFTMSGEDRRACRRRTCGEEHIIDFGDADPSQIPLTATPKHPTPRHLLNMGRSH
jgi:hypothetical protein